MPSRVTILAVACVALCAALVTWKVSLGYSLDPAASADRWNVELIARAEGTGERARLQLAVPDATETQRVYDQSFQASGLKPGGVRKRSLGRFATFTSEQARPSDAVMASYRFSARVSEPVADIAPPEARDTRPSASVPSDAPAVRAKAAELTPTTDDPTRQIRAMYDFVLDEVGASTEPGSQENGSALEALERLRGGPTARVRLFVALARALAVPARVVRAVPLIEGVDKPLLVRAEVHLDGQWIAVDPVHGHFGPDAEEGFVLVRGGDGGSLVRADGLSNVRLSVSVTREGRNEYELYRRRMASEATFIDRVSLHGLPPRMQLVMRLLLLVPLGGLIVSLFRNLVGTPTFGTFMPILIALALRETRPLTGLLVLGVVVAVGIGGRHVLDRLRLLVVPRLSLLLTFVIFIVGALAVGAVQLGMEDVLSAALLPMVIMTMTIERVGVLIEEEGVRSALKTTGGTVLVAGTGYVILQSDALQRMVFTFPELNLLVVAALLVLGRYTGYRLTELLRFRRLVRPLPTSPDGAP